MLLPFNISRILFLDLEIGQSGKGKEDIVDFGAWMDGHVFHQQSGEALMQFADEAHVICGHNVLHHDLEFLKKQPRFERLCSLPVIDTLLLSALIRPKGSHRLEKDYKLRQDSINDPLADAKLCLTLLMELSEKWADLGDSGLQDILFNLCGNEPGLAPFFHRLGYPLVEKTPVELAGMIREHFADKICISADLVKIINSDARLELAFVLSILNGPDIEIITPSWMLIQYPLVLRVFHRLRNMRCTDSECAYCQDFLDPKNNLFRFFKHDEFRSFDGDKPGEPPLQERAVKAALDDKDFIVLFPTGGGKSITFQLPALMRGKSSNALTVVISPLVSLMKDQVDGLKEKNGITQAVAINGLLSPLERAEAIERVANGTAQLLYIAPEALRSKSIASLLRGRIIDRFVIDEAHCFSAWGQDFRVEYLYIGKFIEKLQKESHRPKPIPISCFTATARKEVVEDIKNYFRERLGRNMEIFHTTQGRNNLDFSAIEVQSAESKMDILVEMLESKQVPTIIYVSRTKTASKLAESLNMRSIQAVCFHGKMESEAKKKAQEAFLKGEINTIVATSAFGMGVDKPDVKRVIHYEISSSLENYQQEAGRAGRDPKLEAECIALFHADDLDRNFELLTGTKLNQKEIAQLWSGIKKFKQDRICKSALEFAKEAGWDEDMRDLETRVKSAINALEEAGYVERFENSTRIFADSLLPKSLELAKAKLNARHERFSGKQLENADRVLQYLYRPDTTIEVSVMAEHIALSMPAMDSLLRQFREIEILKDDQDLSAKFDLDKGKRQYKKLRDLERDMLKLLLHEEATLKKSQINLRELNSELSREPSLEKVGISDLRLVLQYWKKHGFIMSERIGREDYRYKLRAGKRFAEEYKTLESRLHLAERVIGKLTAMSKEPHPRNTADGEFWFSMISLKRRVETEDMFAAKQPIDDYARVLLYLHDMKAIELRNGLLIYYQRLNIERKEENNKKQYTKDDYEKLGQHYREKTNQIHFIGDYIKRLIANQDARTFADDYYRLEHKDFVRKYYPRKEQREGLDNPLTEEKFKKLFGTLTPQQLEVAKSNSEKILVAAGPGSGKTMVLVHKMASLLLLENVRPENLLVLTFSRTAAREFKERLVNLAPGLGNHVDILTYHAFAFRLLGKLGDILEADSVVKKATEAIKLEEVPKEKVEARSVIMLDEFQDVSPTEWDFLKAIAEKAEDPRIIAAGDDDQSIFEFRGSSIEAMKELLHDEKGKVFFLTKNHRSAPILVDFANNFLQLFQSERIKSGHPLEPHNNHPGQLHLHTYRGGDLTQAVVASVTNQPKGISSAVLTTSNREAFQVQSMLREKGIPAVLVNSQDGFQIGHLREFVEVTKWLKSAAGEEKKLTKELWEQAIEFLKKQHSTSTRLPLILQAIDLFRQEKPRAYLVDWIENLKMLKMEEVLFPEKGTVFVSTIHKAKGKEFDSVYLLLDRYDLSKEENKRVAYVGITREKSNLEIHTTSNAFDQLLPIGASSTIHNSILPAADQFETECSMKDVVLSEFERVSMILKVKTIFPGQALSFDPSTCSLYIAKNELAVMFSEQMKKQIKEQEAKGFTPIDATVEHIVEWRGKNEDGSYRQPVMVVLPRVRWRRV